MEQVLNQLVKQERKRSEQDERASMAALDSQSVKKVAFTTLDTGIDGNKKVN